jgi:hypothetical protein
MAAALMAPLPADPDILGIGLKERRNQGKLDLWPLLQIPFAATPFGKKP